MAHKRRTITIVSTDSSEHDDVFYDAVVDDIVEDNVVVDDLVEDGNDDEEVVVVQQRRPFTSTPKPPNKRSAARAKTGGGRKEVRRTWEPRPQPRPRSSPKWLMEIKHFQRSVKLLIPRKPFRRLVSFFCFFYFFYFYQESMQVYPAILNYENRKFCAFLKNQILYLSYLSQQGLI
jgi:hypothetical protein